MTTISTIAAVLALGGSVSQSVPAPSAKIDFEATQMFAGGYARAVVTLTFADGLHGYQNPPSEDYQIPVQLQTLEGTGKVLMVKYPEGEPHVMGGETKASMTYGGTVRFPVLIELPKKVGKVEVGIRVRYQQCDESACYPPGRIDVKQTLTLSSQPNWANQVARRGVRDAMRARVR
ncbi:protein-disulfide reductase DsbD family protein [Kamptonema cortianum]|nr:protein-disulfide reductase DsbD family protein [Geitlerinema splendidum]MDK3158522.1 protein-disulfide reductase DsbD family protein [Kamptonema cortianum]